MLPPLFQNQLVVICLELKGISNDSDFEGKGLLYVTDGILQTFLEIQNFWDLFIAALL
jgi:hypothetical protein